MIPRIILILIQMEMNKNQITLRKHRAIGYWAHCSRDMVLDLGVRVAFLLYRPSVTSDPFAQTPVTRTKLPIMVSWIPSCDLKHQAMIREHVDANLFLTKVPFQGIHNFGLSIHLVYCLGIPTLVIWIKKLSMHLPREIIFSLGPIEEKWRILHTNHENNVKFWVISN